MPIFDQGYQHWQGQLSGHTWRWLAVVRHGVRAQMKNRAVRLVMLLAWLPALALLLVLVFWGLLEQKSEMIMPLIRSLALPPALLDGARSYRMSIWTLVYQVFFQYETF